MSRIEGVRNSMVDPAALTGEQKAEVLAAIDYLEGGEIEAIKKLPDGQQALSRWNSFLDSLDAGDVQDFLDAETDEVSRKLLSEYAAWKVAVSKQPPKRVVSPQTAGLNFGGKPPVPVQSVGGTLPNHTSTIGAPMADDKTPPDGELKEDPAAKKRRESKERWEAKEAELKSLKDQLVAAGVEKAKAEQATAEANRLAKEAEARKAQADHDAAKVRADALEKEKTEAKTRRDEFKPGGNTLDRHKQTHNDEIEDLEDEVEMLKRALARERQKKIEAAPPVTKAPDPVPDKKNDRAYQVSSWIREGVIVVLAVWLIWITFSTQCAAPTETSAVAPPTIAEESKGAPKDVVPQGGELERAKELQEFWKDCLAESFPPDYCEGLVEYYKKRQGIDVPTPE